MFLLLYLVETMEFLLTVASRRPDSWITVDTIQEQVTDNWNTWVIIEKGWPAKGCWSFEVRGLGQRKNEANHSISFEFKKYTKPNWPLLQFNAPKPYH